MHVSMCVTFVSFNCVECRSIVVHFSMCVTLLVSIGCALIYSSACFYVCDFVSFNCVEHQPIVESNTFLQIESKKS